MRVARPELWLAAAALVGALLAEVWAGSRVAQLSLDLGQKRTALEGARTRLQYVRADLERRLTRAETVPLAARLDLAPADAHQVVTVPSQYLAADATPYRAGRTVSVVALAERASRALVPEATAQSAAGN
ncbi:MAG: hypothetical protein HY076_02885 [Candidatus Eisenbacteria bacterium]|uniref:Uncharacterized protein n=1 Tax=Eiseniibacteriota bacterium TaxID=2212470 RepID=A0A9D6QNR8_UNCEI|nr:hypothetical protein [Candidatus Eisenbacteria bacterium]